MHLVYATGIVQATHCTRYLIDLVGDQFPKDQSIRRNAVGNWKGHSRETVLSSLFCRAPYGLLTRPAVPVKRGRTIYLRVHMKLVGFKALQAIRFDSMQCKYDSRLYM